MSKNTIKLKNYSDISEESKAAAAITPGNLVEMASATTVRKHATASGNALPMFATEDELQGKGIDDAYATGDVVQVWIPSRGCQVNAILANGQNVAAGDFLTSNGDGTLKKFVAIVDSAADVETIVTLGIVGVALEAVDMSGSSGADPSGRIAVRIV